MPQSQRLKALWRPPSLGSSSQHLLIDNDAWSDLSSSPPIALNSMYSAPPETPLPSYNPYSPSSQPFVGVKLQSPARQLYLDWALTVLTFFWCAGTAFYTYNSTLEMPIISMMFINPQYTLIMVSALS